MESTHEQLMVASRQAGMAEVATGVLHNVGNVLNSVNVSANLVSKPSAAPAPPASPKWSICSINTQPTWPISSPTIEKGKQFPPSSAGLNGNWPRNEALCSTELESLRQNIEHIKEIVAMQQANAHKVGVEESAQTSELMENALK